MASVANAIESTTAKTAAMVVVGERFTGWIPAVD